jgi:hypothetical protein
MIDVYENTVKTSIDALIDLQNEKARNMEQRILRAEQAARESRLENTRMRTRVAEIIGQEMASLLLDEELLDSKTISLILSKRISETKRCKSWLSLRETCSRC